MPNLPPLSTKAKALLAAGAGTTAAGLVALRGVGASHDNQRQVLDLNNQRRQDLSTPMPDFSAVKHAYTKFAADYSTFGGAMQGGAMQGIGQGVGGTIGDILIRKPVDVVGKLLKRKFYTAPRQEKTLASVLGGDADLSAADPQMISGAHATLKRFAPSMTEDPNALRAFLRHAMVTGGTLDPAMIKSLSEAELMHRRAKGEVK